ncbi:HipA domain-containing protein [Desulfurispirillum indicum]|uniref:HipA domain-containing protein n=1 Tax=Desulfurispirillum indicum TaxID=936456 RepID=UPI001CFAA03C|nr:HipA domain-containing protein [Desulfurispirillum indicum]UCZ56626.1 HipA domain-containing protein [Desulfurispirillum indicum]
MNPVLQVTLDHEPIGNITADVAKDTLHFEYEPHWLAGEGFPVSPYVLPGASPESVHHFLSNLLPEGRWLDEVSRHLHISKYNIFGLIGAIGSETAGALGFSAPSGSIASPPSCFREISREELGQRVAGRQNVSIALWDNRLRLSVAGVQEKLPLLIRPDGSMGFGEGMLASSHILKFGSPMAMHVVINEYLCMRLAHAMGFVVPPTQLWRFDGEPVLVVERFDRFPDGPHRIRRRHIIDGCQMLNLPPGAKYERPFGKGGHVAHIRTGANVPDLIASSRHCRVPAVAKRTLLHWVLFNLLIGNSDAHGKNISFFVDRHGMSVAPWYDLLCVEMYGATFEQDLAMAIGDAFDPQKIFAFQLALLCEMCGLPRRQVAKTLLAMCHAAGEQVENLASEGDLTPEERDFAAALCSHIRGKALRYRDVAAELPQVRL